MRLCSQCNYACRAAEPQLLHHYTTCLEQHRDLVARFPTPFQRLEELHSLHKVSTLCPLHSSCESIRMPSPSCRVKARPCYAGQGVVDEKEIQASALYQNDTIILLIVMRSISRGQYRQLNARHTPAWVFHVIRSFFSYHAMVHDAHTFCI